jgi:hypothetical protein
MSFFIVSQLETEFGIDPADLIGFRVAVARKLFLICSSKVAF